MPELNLQIASYLEHCRNVRRLSQHTVAAYSGDLAQFAAVLATARLGALAAAVTAIAVEPSSVEAVVSDVQAAAHPVVAEAATSPTAADIRACLARIAQDKRLAPRSVKRRIAAIRAFLRATDPALALETFATWKLAIRAPAQLPRAIARAELKSLLKRAELEGPQASRATTRLCLNLLAATGLRVSELCALTLGSVGADCGELTVRGKGARERVVAIVNADLRQSLAAHIRALPDDGQAQLPLFRNTRGRPLTPQCLRLRLHALARRARIGRRITPHMMRHTAATLLLEGGVDIRFVQRLLGHASIATTQIYTHVSDTALRSALARADVMRHLL